MPDAAELLTLHALRLRSLCEVDVVAARFDLDPAVVEQVLARAADAGFVRYRSGRLSGWSLTGDGRRHAESLLADELAAAGTSGSVEATYGRFLLLNGRVLEVCTDWQVVQLGGQQVVNDHADAERDAQVLARFSELHAEALPVVAELSGALLATLGRSRSDERDDGAPRRAGDNAEEFA